MVSLERLQGCDFEYGAPKNITENGTLSITVSALGVLETTAGDSGKAGGAVPESE